MTLKKLKVKVKCVNGLNGKLPPTKLRRASS